MICYFPPEILTIISGLSSPTTDGVSPYEKFLDKSDAMSNRDDEHYENFEEGFKLAELAKGRKVWRYDAGDNIKFYYVDRKGLFDWIRVLSVMES